MMHNAALPGAGPGGADHARAVIDSRGRVRSSPPGFLAAHTALGGHLRAAHRQRLGEQHYLYLDDRGTAWRITGESEAGTSYRPARHRAARRPHERPLRCYRRSHAAAPGQASAGVHYDMVHLLAAAWQRASRPWAHDEVADALRTGVYRGVAGAYHFGGPGQRGLSFPDDTGDPSLAHAHLVYQVSGGEHRLIAPGAYATSAFTPPSWLG